MGELSVTPLSGPYVLVSNFTSSTEDIHKGFRVSINVFGDGESTDYFLPSGETDIILSVPPYRIVQISLYPASHLANLPSKQIKLFTGKAGMYSR